VRFEQTKDVIDHVEDFHHQAGRLYAELRQRASNQRVRMLLDYLARHQESLARKICEFKQDSSKVVLNSWFKYTHDEDILKPLQAVDRQSDLDFEAALDLAVRLDEQLLELYQEMAERARSSEVKDIFNNLLLREMEEKQKLMHAALGLMDL
jgi:rubrerythrin